MSERGRTILVVEDDEPIAQGLALNLKLEGFAPRVVYDGEAALESVRESPPGLILLDITLPKKNGLDVLRELRNEGRATPVIVLSARQDEFDKVAALRLGADDYVIKPFGVAELLARIHAVLRRSSSADVSEPQPGATVLQFSRVRVELETREVTRNGEEVKLTHLEFELLSFLLQNVARVFTREQLLRDVWGIQRSGSPRTTIRCQRQFPAASTLMCANQRCAT